MFLHPTGARSQPEPAATRLLIRNGLQFEASQPSRHPVNEARNLRLPRQGILKRYGADPPSLVDTLNAAEVEDDCANSGSEWEPDADTQPDVVQQKKPHNDTGQESEGHPESHAGRQTVVRRFVVLLVSAHLAEVICEQQRT